MSLPRSYSLARILRPLGAVVFSTLCMSDPALAQSAPFRAVDTNGNQVLSYDELVRAFGRASARRLLRQSDTNGDGAISIQELRRSRRAGGSDNDAAGSAPRGGGRTYDRDDDQDDRDDDRDDDDRDDNDDDNDNDDDD